jgi:hypothetical protein
MCRDPRLINQEKQNIVVGTRMLSIPRAVCKIRKKPPEDKSIEHMQIDDADIHKTTRIPIQSSKGMYTLGSTTRETERQPVPERQNENIYWMRFRIQSSWDKP